MIKEGTTPVNKGIIKLAKIFPGKIRKEDIISVHCTEKGSTITQPHKKGKEIETIATFRWGDRITQEDADRMVAICEAKARRQLAKMIAFVKG